MQGHGKNGLPRPYYMKPAKKSPYDQLNGSMNVFNTPRRKIVGYLILLVLFGTCMFWVSQELKPEAEASYEIVREKPKKVADDMIVGSVGKADKESANVELADNLAQDSKGEKGKVVYEAPKGGIANEAPVVGSDEEQLVGNAKKSKQKGEVGGEKKNKGYKAEKAGKEDKSQKIENESQNQNNKVKQNNQNNQKVAKEVSEKVTEVDPEKDQVEDKVKDKVKEKVKDKAVKDKAVKDKADKSDKSDKLDKSVDPKAEVEQVLDMIDAVEKDAGVKAVRKTAKIKDST